MDDFFDCPHLVKNFVGKACSLLFMLAATFSFCCFKNDSLKRPSMSESIVLSSISALSAEGFLIVGIAGESALSCEGGRAYDSVPVPIGASLLSFDKSCSSICAFGPIPWLTVELIGSIVRPKAKDAN